MALPHGFPSPLHSVSPQGHDVSLGVESWPASPPHADDKPKALGGTNHGRTRNVFLQGADSPSNWCWDSATLSRIMTIVILGRKYCRSDYVTPACHSAKEGPFHSTHDAHMFFIVPVHEPCMSYCSIYGYYDRDDTVTIWDNFGYTRIPSMA